MLQTKTAVEASGNNSHKTTLTFSHIQLTANTLVCLTVGLCLNAGLGQRSQIPAGRHRSLLVDINTASYHGYWACMGTPMQRAFDLI